MTKFGDRWFRGSATLASPNSLITAGHCLLQNGVYASEIAIEFGLRIQKTRSCCSCQKKLVSTTTARTQKPLYTIHPDYIQHGDDSPYDAAIITFDQNVTIRHGDDEFQYGSQPFEIGTHYGYAALGKYDEDDLLDSLINITGYPSTVRCSRETCDMFSMPGIVERTITNTLLYKIDTSTGQSGAGIWRIQGDQVELVGIHSGEYSGGFNGGAVLNDSMIHCFSDHLRQYDSVWHAASGLP